MESKAQNGAAKSCARGKNGSLYSLGEEIFNSVTHGVGTLFGLAATVVLLVFAAMSGDVWKIVSSAVYGGCLILLYSFSTLYHALTGKKAKGVFQVLDHCAVYLLIAGTYTPFSLVAIRGTAGYVLFGAVWGLSILGIVLNAVNMKRFRVFSMIGYIATGWAAVCAWGPLSAALGQGGMALLLAGGICYTIGVIFFALKHVKYMHSIWHLFVLLGSVLHFLCVLFYVII